MTPNKPYLLRALNEWILDNGMTPHVLVDATVPGTFVPPAQISDGRIVLNVSPQAVRDLVLDNETLAFHARFGGKPFEVRVPVAAVLAVYAKETGKGMVFPREEGTMTGTVDSRARPARKPTLTVIK